MKTGEGKTLIGTLPAYLNALAGKGVHVVTVNDYLAERDAEWMGRVHRFLGLERRRDPRQHDARPSAASSTPATSPTAPTTSSASTTCATTWRGSKDELRPARPPLRDRRRGRLDPHRRGPHPADHQRPGRPGHQVVHRVRQASCRGSSAADLEDGETATTRSTRRSAPSASSSAASRRSRTSSASTTSTSRSTPRWSATSTTRIKAKELFKQDKDYVVMDGEVLIVDELTGRILAGRRYNEGMHQAIEAKEGVEIKEENQTLATITLQNYFRLYDKLVRHDRYGHDRGRRVPPDLQARRRADPDQPADGPRRTSPTSSTRPRTAKFDAVVEDIAERHEKGQPVLVGTASRREVRAPVAAAAPSAASRTRCSTPSTTSARRRSSPRPAARARSPSPPTWPAAAPTSCSAATPSSSPTAELRQRGLDPVEHARGVRGARWPAALEKAKAAVKAEHDEVVDARRALRARHRAARVAPHRQPAARPLRPSGRPGRVPVLPVARRRPDAAVQGRSMVERVMALAQHPRRRADRVQDGHPRDPLARRPRSSSRTSRSARTS